MREWHGKSRDTSVYGNYRYRRRWKRITSILAIFVAIGTICALMLPAVTMNRYVCGMEEHTHTQECYGEDGRVICGKAEHTHTDACRDPDALTDDEQAQVEAVITAIGELTGIENAQAKLAAFDEAKDTAGRDAYIRLLQDEAVPVFLQFDALSAAEQAAVTNGDILAKYRELVYRDETLTVTGDGYKLTVECPAQAQIPANATVTVKGLEASSPSYHDYLAVAEGNMPEYNLQDARFYDIKILYGGEKIQPAAPVKLTITFDQPMAAEDRETCLTVHFGPEGIELLDAQTIRDDNWIYGLSFWQSSFSVSGAVLAQPMATNAADNGPDAMEVDYYIYLNGKWEKVGSTATGYVSKYNGKDDGTCNGNHNRDYLTVDQVAEVLKKYGFNPNHDNPARTIYYHGKSAGETTMVWSDTATVTYGGKRIIPLSTGTRNYRIYFAPLNTYQGNIPGTEPGTGDGSSARDKIFGTNYATDNSKFYSIDVQDPQKFAFQSESEWKAYRVVFRSGTSPTITLPTPSTGSWSFYHDGGEKNTDLTFTDNRDGTVSCKVVGLTQHLRVIPEGTTDVGPNKLTVTYLVFLDGKWQVVGQTKYGWKGTSTNSMEQRDLISAVQIHSVLHPYGFRTDVDFSRQLAYQQKSEDSCYSDTGLVQLAGSIYFPLSVTASEGYNIYYIPNNTTVLKAVSGGGLPATSNRFWSITVVDEFHWCYTPAELDQINAMSAYVPNTGTWNHFAAVAKEGSKGSVTVKRAGFAWRWHTAEKDANGDPVFPYREAQELNWVVDGDNIIVTTNENMDKQLFLNAYDNSLRMDAAGPQAGDITTVSGQGITFKLFNYRADINEVFYKRGLLKGPTVRPELDSPNYFAFRDQESPWKYHTLNSVYDMDGYWFYNDGIPDRTMVLPNLSGGYPVLDMTHRGHVKDPVPGANKSLAVLFSGGEYVKQYNCANTPLRFDTSDGYYKYDSARNAADYSTATNTWYVRNRVERGQDTAEKYPGYADFLPFNNCTGEQFGTTGGVPYQYKMLDIDYWFGMTMSVNFFQGKDGKIEYNDKNDPMEFHFSGDDDVWVFLDNMLVLDIGGTHGAVDGFINFNTGLVTTAYNFGPAAGNDPNWAKAGHSSATTIYECYEYALRSQGVSGDALTEKLNEIFVSTGETVTDSYTGKSFPVYRFKDYSSHKMNFFYMERGGGSSNCAISFNLPTLPDESLIVGKELEFDHTSLTPEQIAFAEENLTYRFRVVDANGDPLFTDQQDIQVLNEALKPIDGLTTSTDAEGWFTLKAGQRVQFEHMLKTIQDLGLTKLEYYVQEAIPASLVGQYNGVVYKDGGTSGAVNIEGQAGTEWIIYKTNALSPENTYTVIYTNKVDVEKMSFLQIRKEVQPGSVYTGKETFPVVVTIAGEPVAAGTRFHYTDNNEVVTAGEGGVVQLQIGRTLQLSAPVMAGTQFEVKENASDGWTLVGYTATHGTADDNSVSGEIPLDATVLVIVTNRTMAFKTEVPITKVFLGGSSGITRTATFRMEQVTDRTGATLATGTLAPSEIKEIMISCGSNAPVEGRFQLEYQYNTPDGTYYYRITEIAQTVGSTESFIPDDTVYVVEVTVGSGTAAVRAVYVDGEKQSGTAIAFVNRFATVQLPATGGAGTSPYIFSGTAVMLLAGALMYKVKRKQRRGEM